MSQTNHLVVRGKDFLPALLLLQVLPAVISGFAFFMVPSFMEIYADVLGEDEALPLITNVVLHTYLLWLLIPLLLVGLSIWVCRTAKTIAGPMLVLVISFLVPIALFLSVITALCLPFFKLVTCLKT